MDPSFGRNFAFRFAVSHNLVNLVQILLEHPLVDPFDVKSQVLKFATKQGDQLIMELLRSRINTLFGSNITFLEACRDGQDVVVECLLSKNLVDPAYKSNFGIILAARNGHVRIIEMLLGRADVDPSADRNKALKLACFHGYGDIVKLLLKDDRVNHYSALILACKNGHTNVVKIIFENRRYHSQKDLNLGFSIAISGGHLEIVEYLLDNTPINFNIGEINPIVIASIYGNLSILKRLLRDRRYQVGGKHLQFELNRGLYEALKKNHVELVDFFLTKTTAMPSTVTDSTGLGFEAALIACRFGHEEVLKRLMKDHRVVMTEMWIFKAAINGHAHIVKLLLKNAKNDSVARLLKAAMEGAQKRNHKNIIKYLSDL
jgi:ankyrin repeat protein